jgi:DNA-directed RNA polymerase beta subunit
MYDFRDEYTFLELIQSLLKDDLNIKIENIDIEEPIGNLNYHIDNALSYYYTLRIFFRYENSFNLEDKILKLPKLDNSLYFYKHNDIAKLKVMVNTFLLQSPFTFKMVKNHHQFYVPKLFTININKNTIFYKSQNRDLNELDSLNIKLPDRCWKKLNYYNNEIQSNEFTLDIFKNTILPTLYKNEEQFKEVTYWDLSIKTLKDKFLESLNDNKYVMNQINLYYKKHKKLYLNPLQSFINNFFNIIDNNDIQTLTTTNPMSLESQINKVYIVSKNKKKIKINYNKSFLNFFCPVHTHEGKLNNVRNELSQLVDLESFKLKLINNKNERVLIDHYTYFNSYLYIDDNTKLYRGEYITSDKWDYKKRHRDDLLSISSSCIPMLNSTDSVRGILGTTMISQTIPVIGSSPSIIYTEAEREIFNRCKLNIYSNNIGIITNLKDDQVIIDDEYIINRPDSIKSNNNTYNNYYLNPDLKLGDSVRYDSIIFLLDSFKNNQLTLSVQARIGYMNYYGFTFEDGIVISKSLSRKLGHIHREKLEYNFNDFEDINFKIKKGDISNKNNELFEVSVLTNNKKLQKIKELLDIDQNEHIQILLPTHIDNAIILNITLKYKDNITQVIKSKFDTTIYDNSLQYNYSVIITVEYVNYAKLGDKITNRYGSKGVITKIVEDNMMPVDEDGISLEVIMSPDSIISRKNVSQVYEVILGNILTKLYKMNLPKNHEVFSFLYKNDDHNYYHDFAKKYGYYTLSVNAMNEINLHDLINKLSSILNIDSEIKLYDPISKRYFYNKILVGYTSLLRLHFIVEHKAKSTNDYRIIDKNVEYSDEKLIGGGFYKKEGQKIGEMEMWTFLSYNNLELLKYLQTPKIRKDKSDTLKLSMLMSGIKPII